MTGPFVTSQAAAKSHANYAVTMAAAPKIARCMSEGREATRFASGWPYSKLAAVPGHPRSSQMGPGREGEWESCRGVMGWRGGCAADWSPDFHPTKGSDNPSQFPDP